MAFIGSVGKIFSYIAPQIYYPVAAIANIAQHQNPLSGTPLSALLSHPTGHPIQPGALEIAPGSAGLAEEHRLISALEAGLVRSGQFSGGSFLISPSELTAIEEDVWQTALSTSQPSIQALVPPTPSPDQQPWTSLGPVSEVASLASQIWGGG
jgi:hypothetical protein